MKNNSKIIGFFAIAVIVFIAMMTNGVLKTQVSPYGTNDIVCWNCGTVNNGWVQTTCTNCHQQLFFKLTVYTTPINCNVSVYSSGIGAGVKDINGVYHSFPNYGTKSSGSTGVATWTNIVPFWGPGNFIYISVSKSGYGTKSMQYMHMPQDYTQSITLETFTVNIQTNPVGCDILFGSNTQGQGTLKNSGSTGIVTYNVGSGTYWLQVSKSGYASYMNWQSVSANKNIIIVLQSLNLGQFGLTVNTLPSGATVTVHGIIRTSNCTFSALDVSEYQVDISKNGYFNEHKYVYLDHDTILNVNLTALTYDLIIQTTPTNIWLTLSGYGPQNSGDSGQVFFTNLLAGTYTLTASKTGYVTVTRTITIGQDATVNIALTPIEGGQGPVPPIPQQKTTNYILVYIAIATIALVALLVYLKRRKK